MAKYISVVCLLVVLWHVNDVNEDVFLLITLYADSGERASAYLIISLFRVLGLGESFV
jgi:hypothetical protein